MLQRKNLCLFWGAASPITALAALLLVFCTAAVAPGCRSGHSETPPTARSVDALAPEHAVEPSPDAVAFADRVANEFRASGTPGAALVVVENGKAVLYRTHGVRSTETGDPVDTLTLFRTGSLSKGFAAVVAGLAVQRGDLRWDDPITHWVPEFRTRLPRGCQRDICVSDILSHTAGFCYHAFSASIDQGHTMDDLLRNGFPNTRLYSPPGQRYAYQNAAFSLIQPVLQSATGMSYQRLLERDIFKAAGMDRASCDWNSIVHQTNVAVPHRPNAYGRWEAEPIQTNYYDDFAAAGGVNASISDMGRWLEFLMRDDAFSLAEATKDQLFKPRACTGGERPILPSWIHRNDAHYGLGWRVLCDGSDTFLYHSGYVNGYRAEIAFDRKTKRGLCILTNGRTDLSEDCISGLFRKNPA